MIQEIIKQLGGKIPDIKAWLERNKVDSKEIANLFTTIFGTETLKAAWNYREVETDKYTFKELLQWAKDNIQEGKHNGVAVVREKADGKIILSAMFLGKNDEPLSSLGEPYLHVKTQSIDSDLEENFGDKDMIVLQ
ncbi:hypothetical protein CQA53_04470 [Helicobacter didelphidarum]|uniref:Uncharacterized protein n=1 Tax=Helicobacter didelphidarum TaxID=2040648 RepID=A0A3D8IN54_9HELI|nr:hypothetical protein [Helicobacter didelphidarum]RDU66064.1 hypothetical protein CQA53_04470 [Helicobacter didelphidarum]